MNNSYNELENIRNAVNDLYTKLKVDLYEKQLGAKS